MSTSSIALFFMAVLLAAVLVEPLARRLKMPFSAALVAGGFAASQAIIDMGLDTGLRWYHFHDLVFFVFLPALIFHSAFNMDARQLFRNTLPIFLLALPILLLSTLLTATLLYFGIGHPQGFPWISALVCGALLSATDPVAVSEIAKRSPVPRRLLTLMEGESLFNDATTVVLFMLLLSVVTTPGAEITLAGAGLDFLRLAVGGTGVGLVLGLAAGLLMRWFERPIIVSLLAAYASYLIAETQLGVSGVMAVLACGLVSGHLHRQQKPEQYPNTDNWWAQLGWLANSSLFLLAGVTITLPMFQERWLAMLLGIGAALLTRALGVWMVGALTAIVPGQTPVSTAYRLLMVAGGLRGAVTLALALSLPVELEGWWTVQSIAYGVVLFSLVFQAPTIEPLLDKLQKSRRL